VLNLSDDGKCTLDSPDQGAYGIAATTNFVSSDSVNVKVASLNASYAARLQNGELKGTFTQNGFKLPLSLKPSEKVELKRPQNPQPPYPYKTEEVTFQNTKAGATLAGTLSKSPDKITYGYTVYPTGQLKGFDIKPTVGIGYRFNKNSANDGFYASLRYSLGTSKLAGDFPGKISCAELTIGYLFKCIGSKKEK